MAPFHNRQTEEYRNNPTVKTGTYRAVHLPGGGVLCVVCGVTLSPATGNLTEISAFRILDFISGNFQEIACTHFTTDR